MNSQQTKLIDFLAPGANPELFTFVEIGDILEETKMELENHLPLSIPQITYDNAALFLQMRDRPLVQRELRIFWEHALTDVPNEDT